MVEPRQLCGVGGHVAVPFLGLLPDHGRRGEPEDAAQQRGRDPARERRQPRDDDDAGDCARGAVPRHREHDHAGHDGLSGGEDRDALRRRDGLVWEPREDRNPAVRLELPPQPRAQPLLPQPALLVDADAGLYTGYIGGTRGKQRAGATERASFERGGLGGGGPEICVPKMG